MAGTEGPPIVEVEPDSYGGDRLKTLADGGLSFLWDVVVWAGGVLKVKSDADPLDCPTLKEQSNAARIGTVAAVELVNKRYPKLTQNRNESLDLNAAAKMLLDKGDIDANGAAKQLKELQRNMLPNGEKVRGKLLAAAKKADHA